MRTLPAAFLILLTVASTSFGQAARPATQTAAQAAQPAPQTPRLRGRVLDTSGGVMPAAEVRILQNGNLVTETLANATGDFDVELPAGEYQLEIAFVDFNTHRETVRVVPNMRPLSVTLS